VKVYEELQAKRVEGKILSLDSLTPELLNKLFIEEKISDYQISQLFNAKESQITYRRRKHGITIKNSVLDDLLMAKTDKSKKINDKYKEQLMNIDNLSMISKAITHFAFRNGPIEDMHAGPNSQLSQEDMKTLNKYMVNRIAFVFKLIIENRWIELDLLIRHTDMIYGQGWDNAEPDDDEHRKIIELMLKI
jgi:hypothetical protein